MVVVLQLGTDPYFGNLWQPCVNELKIKTAKSDVILRLLDWPALTDSFTDIHTVDI